MTSFLIAAWARSRRIDLVPAWIRSGRKSTRKGAQTTAFFKDLGRLATTSPHLLEDIGFTRCATPDPANEQVWQSQTLRLVLITRGSEPVFHVDQINPDARDACS